MFVGENLALLDFIDIMDNEELLLNGEYVVLAIDNSIDDVSDNQVLTIIFAEIFISSCTCFEL